MTEVRDRLNHRITASRLKLEAKRSGPNFVVYVIGAAVALAGLAWILGHVASNLVRSSSDVAFEVASARAVRPGLNEVRVRGIPAGRISGVELRDGRAVVKVSVEEEYGEIYRNARAELRPNSALEDQFLDIVDRGTRRAGVADPDEPLPPAQTTTPVGVDAVLNTFSASTRTRLRVLLDQLGHGLEDRGGQLQHAFAEAVPLLRVAGRATKQLAARKPLTRRLVHNTGVLMRELSRRDRQLRTLVREGATTAGALQQSAPDLDATLRGLPPTLAAVETSFTATRGVLGDVNTAVRALRPVAANLDDALDALASLSDDADPAVRALQSPVRRLVPLARALAPLSHQLDLAVQRLRPQVDTLDTTTVDLVECKKGVQGFFQWDASMTKFGDVRGQAPRGNLAAGVQTLGLSSPDEAAYRGCTPGGPIGGRPPTEKDFR